MASDKGMHEMTAESVLELVEAITKLGAQPCIGGGWGVDALLARQPREHADLDLWLVLPILSY